MKQVELLADRVRTARAMLGIDLDELAQRAGLDPEMLRALETGAGPEPTLSQSQALATAFDIPLATLVSDDRSAFIATMARKARQAPLREGAIAAAPGPAVANPVANPLEALRSAGLSLGQIIILAGAGIAFISLFLTWFTATPTGEFLEPLTRGGIGTLGGILALLGVIAIAVSFAGSLSNALSGVINAGRAQLARFGGVVLCVIGLVIGLAKVGAPTIPFAPDAFSTGYGLGIWVFLIAVLAIVAGLVMDLKGAGSHQ